MTWGFSIGEMCWTEGVAKKALRGDDLETPVAKKGFRSDGGVGRFARGSAKAQVAEGLFSTEEIIHFAIVTDGALFGHTSSLPRPFLASALPNPSPPAGFLALRAIFALGGDNPKQLSHSPWPWARHSPASRGLRPADPRSAHASRGPRASKRCASKRCASKRCN